MQVCMIFRSFGIYITDIFLLLSVVSFTYDCYTYSMVPLRYDLIVIYSYEEKPYLLILIWS